jgi:hypothetical protein
VIECTQPVCLRTKSKTLPLQTITHSGPVSFPTRRSSVGDSYVVRPAGGGNKENTVSISIVDVGRNSDDIVGNSASEISRQ